MFSPSTKSFLFIPYLTFLVRFNRRRGQNFHFSAVHLKCSGQRIPYLRNDHISDTCSATVRITFSTNVLLSSVPQVNRIFLSNFNLSKVSYTSTIEAIFSNTAPIYFPKSGDLNGHFPGICLSRMFIYLRKP
jgi:hypothetical protein